MWLRGPMTMLLGFALLGLVPVLVRATRDAGFSAPEVVLVRFAIALLLIPVAIRVLRQPLATQRPGMLVARGVLGGLAVIAYFTSVQMAGAGVGTLLNYTYPLWANLFGVFFGEPPRRLFWPLFVVALAGVYLVVDPVLSGVGLGEAIGLVSATFAGAAVLCIKRLRKTDGEVTVIASFSLVGLLVGAAALPWVGGFSSVESWQRPGGLGLLVAIGLVSFAGHVYFTRGYKFTSLQLGSVVALLVPVVATLGGWLFLNEPLKPRFLLGGALIVGACLALSLSEKRTLPESERPA
jgi:drug/metabolite transporter (DMT)-like permease